MANKEVHIIDLTSDDESGDPPPQAPTADLDDDDDNPLPQDDSSDDDDNPLPQRPPADSDSDSDDKSQSQPRGAVYEMWMFCDEKLMLTTLADERRRSGELLLPEDLFNALRGKLERKDAKVPDVSNKISNLKRKFQKANEKGGPGKKDRDRRLFELSKPVWPELLLVDNHAPVVIVID